MADDERDLIFECNETTAYWLTSLLVAEAVLVELLRARGGADIWFDTLRADLVKRTKNLCHEGLSIEQEVEVVSRTVRLVNGIFDGALKAFERDRSV
ncbi:MAG: hypothetical protein HC900_06670 [Methylacidiphilales bacterium]|nr:hypothetical protein [Candidatus Methylacidiphilales bacterium]